jgi:hypothetical protein
MEATYVTIGQIVSIGFFFYFIIKDFNEMISRTLSQP